MQANEKVLTRPRNPDDEFVKMVGRQIYGGMLTKSVVEQLKSAVQSSLDEVIRNRIQDKLNVAFRPDPVVQDAPVVAIQELPDDRDIHTTEEEMMAFMMVKAIAARYIDVSRRDSRF